AGEYILGQLDREGQYSGSRVRVQAGCVRAVDVRGIGQLNNKPEPWLRALTEQKYFQPATTPWRPNVYLPQYRKGVGRRITGYIHDTGGEPLIGASILVKGTSIGTVSDIDGSYELWAPLGNIELVVSYTGFSTQEILALSNSRFLDLQLEEGVHLEEAVMTSLGVSRKINTNQTLANLDVGVLQSATPGLSVRGSRNEATNIYVDGVAVGGHDMNPDMGYAIKGNSLAASSGGIRTDFRDNAYWQPHLLTDRSGRATFEVTFPEDITSWRQVALTSDRRARLGIGQALTQAYLPVQAQLYTPRFVVEGDQASVIGLLTNRTGEKLRSLVTLTEEGQPKQAIGLDLEGSERQLFTLAETALGQDSIRLTYALQTNTFQDGEQRSIPVFRKGTLRRVGDFQVLHEAG
ncbi:MAG: carboxypeptidase-like regulatory domain-containing protein, partial [Bacteroidota bacterium]